jgi:pimeloyl-ACP methyl ester carboxylesterase
MPGYGWSGPTHQQGWDIRRVAEANATLMAQLGYERYGAQGGDWGAIATTLLGLADPDHLIGLHVNMVVAGPPTGSTNPMQGLSDLEMQAVADMTHFQQQETGYQAIQGTKPQTLGYGLTDSPAGLAGWIVEKFRTWSDCNGDVESSFTKDQLLTNITTYWVTNTISSSVRLYCESQRARANGPAPEFVEVPTGAAIFPKELYRAPRSWAEAAYNLKHWTVMPRGGHFAAMEEPELLVDDIRAFFRLVR